MAKAGHFFTLDSKGITGELVRLLQHYGLQHVQTRAYVLDYRAGTVEGQQYYEAMKLSETLLPFIRKWTQLPKGYSTLHQQALEDMQQPDFVATLGVLTAWGTSRRS